MERQPQATQQGAEYAFLEDNVEDLRARQQDIYDDNSIDAAEKTARIEAVIGEYLGDFGVADDDDKRADYEAILRAFSVDKIGTSKWRFGDWNATAQKNEGKTGRDLLYDKQEEVFGKRLFKDDLDNAIQAARNKGLTPEEWADVRDDVSTERDEYVKKYGELIGERSKNMIERANTREEINKLKEEAADYVNGFATQMMDELQAAGKTKEEIAETVDEFVNEQMNALMSAMETHRQDEYEKSSPVMKYVYDKWAKWTHESPNEEGKTKFLSWGRAKKLAATALPAAGITAAATALAPISIGVGAGALIVGGVALVSKSVGRNLAGGFLDRKSREKKLAAEQSEEIKKQYEAEMQADDSKQRKTIFEVADHYSEYYRKQNRNRTLTGVAVAGTFGLLGGTVGALAADKLDGADLMKPINWLKDKFGFSDDQTTDKPDTPGDEEEGLRGPDGDRDGDDVINSEDPDKDNDGVLNEHDSAPLNPNVWEDSSTPDLSEVPHDARWVEHGEGGWQTLQELGVPQEKWEAVWANAGEQFEKEGKTYPMDDGRYGWSEPGRMTNEDITTLLQAAKEEGVELDFTLAA